MAQNDPRTDRAAQRQPNTRQARRGGWGKNDEAVTGGWGANDELLTDDEVFGSKVELPPGVKPSGLFDDLVPGAGPAGGLFDDLIPKRDLPPGVKPSAAGAGRGSAPGKGYGQGSPAAPLPLGNPMGDDLGGQPVVGDAPYAYDKNRSVLDRLPPGQDDPNALSPRLTDADLAEFARQETAPWKRAEQEGPRITGTITGTPRRGILANVADATLRKPLDESLGGLALETVGDAVRGAGRGVYGVAGSVWSGLQAGAETAGLGDTAFAGVAGEAGRAARAERGRLGNPLDPNSLTQQVFESTFSNLPVLATLGFGNPALLAMGAQAAANDYGESRDAGLDHERASGRAAFMGVAEVIGERFGLPQLGTLFAKAAAKATTKEMGRVLADMLVKEQIGEQVTTALQSGYEKFGEEGRKPNMTLADYLDDVANTAKVTLGQSLLMAGGAAAVRALPQPVRAEGSVAPAAPVTPLLAEDMRTTPITPDEVVGLAQAAQQQRAQTQARMQPGAGPQEAAQRPADAQVAPTPYQPAQQRQQPGIVPAQVNNRSTGQSEAGPDRQRPAPGVPEGETDRAAQRQPGQIAQGSIAKEARRSLESRQPETKAPSALDSLADGAEQPATQQPAQRAAQLPARSSATTQPAAAPDNQAGTTDGKQEPSQRQADTGPTYRSRDETIVAIAQAGQWQTHEPVRAADGTWSAMPRQEAQAAKAEPATPTAPPQAAHSDAGTAAQQQGPRQAQPTVPKVPPSAAQGAGNQVETAANPPVAAPLQTPAEASAPVHAEPGQPAEPATPPVVAASVGKAASATDRKPAELRADLVRQIDAALGSAHDEVLPTWKRPSKERLRQAMVDLRLGSLERAEQALRNAHENRVAEAADRIGFVNFDVPGDGSFKVLNTANRLAEFKRLVAGSAGFKAQRASSAPEPDGAQRGSASVKAAVENMLAEGDAQAAADYLHSKGTDAAELGLPASMLAKLAGVTPTAMQEDDAAPAGRPSDAGETDAPGAASATQPGPADSPFAARPHELTQAQFMGQVELSRAGNASNPWAATWHGHQLDADPQAMDHPDLGKTVAMGGRFFKTKREAAAAAKSAHRRAVRRAQQDGRAVPDDVLADYPDLAPQDAAEASTDASPLVIPDTLGIDRARLAGRMLTFDVKVKETGADLTMTMDAEKLMAEIDFQEQSARSGTITVEDSPQFAERMANLLGSGIEPTVARKRAIDGVVADMQRDRKDAEELIRTQHPDLFLPGSGEQASPQRIEDFGEVIPGARKEAARAWADKLALAETLTATEEPLSKLWPEPDYQRLVDGGVDAYLVAFTRAARDSVPNKPSAAWKLKGWAANVTALRDLAKQALTGQATPEGVRAALAAMPSAHRDIAGVADLYRALGHGVSLKGITLQQHSYSFRDGKHHSPPLAMWTVEKPARATAMSNWPNELATGATKDEAIANFKPRHQLMLAGVEVAAPKAPTRFDIVAYRGKPGVTIGKKVGREFIALKTFDTAAEARQFRQEQVAELERLLAEAKAVPPERRAENLPRIGVDHRDAGDVTPAQFTDAFGFKGVQFGNYVEGDRRQRDLNDAYDALMDLAGVLGLPSRSLSLGGTIGLAFGARGHGGKNAPSAHFEPVRVAINLTKGGGAGSLAHELFHAIDNAFARQRNEPLGFLTQRPYARGTGVRPEMVAAFKRLMDTIKSTGLATRSAELDKTRSKPYWGTDLEMAARSFESYVVAKLQDQGAANDYLANIVSEDSYSKPGAYPYPTAAESPAIRAAFDEFFATVQTREDEAGNVALFQRRGAGRDQAERNALRALSQNDELFALPRSGGRTVSEIAADIDPQIGLRTSTYAGQVMHRLTMPDGTFAFIIERKPSPFGPDVYGHESQDQPIVGRPGVNPEDVDPTARDIFIDASNLSPGGAGREVYAIAATYAHNTDAIFIGDPAGLSDEALRRRPEQMLSSALKFGTTRHLAPHPRQVAGDASLGVPPLRWVYGDDLGNIRRLVDLNLKALENQGYDNTSLSFDLPTGRFLDAAGQEVGRAGLGAWVEAGAGRSALAGSTTLARGAVLRALVREASREGEDGGQRDGLLERIAGLGSNPAATGLFYARQPGAAADPVADEGRLRLVRAAVQQITGTWANAPEIEVLASMQDAPEPVRQANIRQLAAGAQGQPAAFYFRGKVYLLAGQMGTHAEVAESVAHEALGHFGLRGFFGAEMGQVLDELAALREADVRAKAAEYGLDYADQAQRQQAAEEVLAELAQTEPELGLVQRAIAAIRTWLREHIPALADLALSDAEIVRSFILPARAFVVDGLGAAPASGASAAAAFARKNTGASAAAFKAWLDETGGGDVGRVRFTDSGRAVGQSPAEAAQPTPAAALPATIEVDGQARPTSDSQGNQIAGDEAAVRAFWQKFAGSTMVDADGRPLVLAVGSEQGKARITPRSRGAFGAGVYLRESTADARRDAPAASIVGNFAAKSAYAVLKKPYVVEGARRELPASFKGFGQANIVSAAGRLIEATMPAGSQAQMFARMWHGKADFGDVFRKRLAEQGFDGLVVRFADAADGGPLFVAFNGAQVIQAGGAVQASEAPAGRTGATAVAMLDAIDVDGQQRPVRNSRGQVIHSTEDGVRNFWRWFGDSAEVDALGRPLVLYHGTQADFTEFRPSPLGFYGPGVYATTDASTANVYAENSTSDDGQGANVMPIYLAMRNPYRYSAKWDYLPSWFKPPAGFDNSELSLLSAAPKLIEDILPRAEARQMIERMLGGEQIGEALRARLVAMGHDGLIVSDDGPDGDGGNEHIAFDKGQVKSAMGNDGSFGVGVDDIRFQRRIEPEQQPAREFALRPFGKAGRAIEIVQDRYNRWKHAIDDVRRQGGSITDGNDFYRAEERYWGQVGGGIEAFKAELSTFVQAVHADGLTVDDVALYAYAQHVDERNDFIARRRPDMPDGGSGMTSDEAGAILGAAREAGVEAELQGHAATLRRWIQGTRDVLRDGGLIDQEQHDTWTRMFEHYVPLRGAGEATEAAGEGRVPPGRLLRRRGGVHGEEAEHAQGRQEQALQIVEQIANDRARALIRVGRNEVLRSFARFVLDNPSLNLWEVNAVERRRTATVDEDGYRQVSETEEVIKDGRTITLKDGGDEIHILVKDAKLLEQLQRMGLEDRPAWAIGALLSANRWLSRVYTSLSPVFTAMNALRDTQAAAIGMIDEIGLLGAPKLFAALPKAWADSFKAEAGKPSADYQVFKAMGGVTHFHNLTTVEQQARELESIVADAERSALNPRKFLPKAMALIEALNGGIENATRLAAFNVARADGMTASQAASVAKNITVNFNRRGTQSLASAWILFFNPAVQGTVRVAQAMANPKVQAAMGVAMLGVAALALRNAGMGDDDDGVAWWDKIPDEVKERNLVIVLPPGVAAGEAVPKSKTGRYIKVPMPYGYNFFAVVANQVVDVWRHSQDARRGRDLLRAGSKGFSAFASSWLPAQDLGRAVSADDAESAGKSAVLLLVPDALDPLARIGINVDSFGRTLRPDDNRFNRNQPDSAHYFSGQHGTLFQRGAAAMNQATGGSRFRSGMVDVAPSTMEHLARSYGGGPVGFGLDIINALYVRQTISRPELDAKRLPFAKQFIGTIDAETDRMTGYQRLDAAEKLIDPIKRATTAGDAEEVRAMREEAGPVAGLGDAVLQTRQRLGEIVKRERATIDKADMPDSLKYVRLLELAEQRRAVLQRFNAAYDRAVQAAEQQKGAR